MLNLILVLTLGNCAWSPQVPPLGFRCVYGDCQRGFGLGVWPNGDSYLGDWRGGKKQGWGCFTWVKTGQTYLGQWQNNQMQGRGSLFGPKNLAYQGFWAENRFVLKLRPQWTEAKQREKFAEQQIQTMLQERPAMQSQWQAGDSVARYVLGAMAGKDCPWPLLWQGKADGDFSPPQGLRAVHRYPSPSHEGLIWISPDCTGEQAWAAFLFELHNIAQHSKFRNIEDLALKGRYNKRDYLRAFAAAEHEAGLATAKFYREVWLKQGKTGQAQDWYAYLPLDFETWWQSLDTHAQAYPRYPYEMFYDSLISRSIRRY